MIYLEMTESPFRVSHGLTIQRRIATAPSVSMCLGVAHSSVITGNIILNRCVINNLLFLSLHIKAVSNHTNV